MQRIPWKDPSPRLAMLPKDMITPFRLVMGVYAGSFLNRFPLLDHFLFRLALCFSQS